MQIWLNSQKSEKEKAENKSRKQKKHGKEEHKKEEKAENKIRAKRTKAENKRERAMSEKDYIELLELQRVLKDGIEEIMPEKVWVRAEVSSISVKAGNCYLELSQNEDGVMVAKARAAIWRSQYAMLAAYFEQATGTPLRQGLTILARCRVSFSELYGMTLVIDDIDARTSIGEKELQKRKTIERLEREGLMDMQKELELPVLPYALAVISASGAAGYGDFCNHLHNNEYGFVFRTELFEATMQGINAPESIADALSAIEEANKNAVSTNKRPFDAVLILRGGGSNIDLDCFDDYSLAVAIANCSLPVFTAIGHERDYHIADMVAHGHVKTPTALADEFISRYMDEDAGIEAYSTRLRLAFSNRINAILSKLDVLEARIKGADSRNVLSRGYVLTLDSRGRSLKSAKKLKKGDTIQVMFSDGSAECEVKEIKKN